MLIYQRFPATTALLLWHKVFVSKTLFSRFRRLKNWCAPPLPLEKEDF
nr:MAG TPA: hypothetical protein [Caudoviricetes sp.]